MAQPLNNITIAAPGFFGINTQDSPTTLNQGFALVAENAVIDQLGRVGARKGYTVLTTDTSPLNNGTIDLPVEGIFEYLDNSGNTEVISVGNAKVFKGTTTLTDITPAAYTITANNWKGTSFNDFFFLFQANQDPLYYDGTTCDLIENHANYSGTVPLGNEVLASFGRLWVVGADKSSIYWSDLLNGFSWDTGSAGSINIAKVWPDSTDEIVAIASHNNFLIIFGKRQILVYQGADDPATMSLADTIVGVGCIARDSVQPTGMDLVFLADSGLRSFNRVIQEKSLPMRDLSKNIRSDLMREALNQTVPIKSTYNEDEAFYLLSLPTSNVVYCFDMRGFLEDQSARATQWTSFAPRAMKTRRNGSLLFGFNTGIAEYTGYNDNDASYRFKYYSSYLDFDAPSNLKFLKRMSLTLVGGQGTTATMFWGYDYTSSYNNQPFTFSSTNIAEYGESEYNVATSEYNASVIINTPKVNTSGSGTVVQIGMEADVNNAPFSIQRIDIQTLVGRIV